MRKSACKQTRSVATVRLTLKRIRITPSRLLANTTRQRILLNKQSRLLVMGRDIFV